MKILPFAVTILLASNVCFAQVKSTEPRDFRGMEWDTHFSAIPGMVKQFSKDEKIDVFKREGDEMRIDQCPLDDLHYETFSGRIFKAIIRFSKCSPSMVYNDFKNKYGECTKIEDSFEYFICFWDWKRVKIEYSIDSESGATEIVYTYKMTEREYALYLKEKAGVKKDLF